MSDRLAVMRDGEIEQVGTPREVYDSPESTYVADFLGLANLISAHVPSAGTVEIDGRRIRRADRGRYAVTAWCSPGRNDSP